MIYISPSLLAADFSCLTEEIEKIENAGAEYLHLDVMDGVFVPNISFGPGVISCIRKKSSLFFDVHLMITKPERYIEEFVKAGANSITIHYESTENPKEVLETIKQYEMKAGIAISPNTPVDKILPLLQYVDMALIMTVEPGFGGQSLIMSTLSKVYDVKKYIKENNLNCLVEVDGGINSTNLSLLTSSGADVIVAGSAVFKSKNPKNTIKEFREIADSHPFIN